MKRASLPGLVAVMALVTWLLVGCSSYTSRHVDQGPANKKVVFVQSNLNDNNAIDTQIVAALRERGYEAECGPLTMMQENAQVIVAYEDHWNWDFGDHLAYLQLTARDRHTGFVYASANFSAKIPSKKSVAKVINELLDRLISEAKAKR